MAKVGGKRDTSRNRCLIVMAREVGEKGDPPWNGGAMRLAREAGED